MGTRELNRQAFRPAEVDVMVLTLLEKEGLRTVFDLFSRARLSPGSTAAALRRMEQAGLVRAGKPGKQRRLEFSITARGQEILIGGWRVVLEPEPADFESAVRRAWLAECLEGSGGSDQLQRAARSSMAKAKERQAEASKLRSSVSDIAALYAWLKAFCDARRLKSDARVLSTLAQEIESELPKMAGEAGAETSEPMAE